VIPWLPFLCFVPVAPAGWIANFVSARLRGPAVAVGLTALASAAGVLWTTTRLPHEGDYYATSRERTDQIVKMDQWVSQHIPPDSYLLETYYALSGDGFYRWIESAGVRVPDLVNRRRDLTIWWLDRRYVEGKAGFVCISRADISILRADLERDRPASTLNPFEDVRFHPLARFGTGFYELQIFQFDSR